MNKLGDSIGFQQSKAYETMPTCNTPNTLLAHSFGPLYRTMISRSHALALLSLCDGDEIWSVAYCREQRVPESWIRELADAFESGFDSDRDTIYYAEKPVNHYEGVLAVDLAMKLASVLGVSPTRLLGASRDRDAIVREIRETLEEG